MKPIQNSSECPKCGGGHKSKPFCLYENGWYCFSCAYTKSADRGFIVQNRNNNIPDWPEATNDFNKFSVEAQIFLSEYSITAEDARKYNIYYVEDNLIYAVFEPVLFYQKRKITERGFTTHGQKLPTRLINELPTNTLVIVEDYISAVSVFKAGLDTLCLWGTKMAYKELQEWFRVYENILVWLDNDDEKQTNSGQVAAKKIMAMGKSVIKNRYGFGNKTICNIIAEMDPKYFSVNRTRKIIKEVLNDR